MGSGKSAVTSGLCKLPRVQAVRVREALAEILGGSDWDRMKLQVEGAALDLRTDGTWLCQYLREKCDSGSRWVVDSARTRRQVAPVLTEISGARLVFLAASEATRRQRFKWSAAADPVKQSMPFDAAMSHDTEGEAATISAMAHLLVDTEDLSLDDVVETVASWLGWI